ncbi:MAG: hypothetical protein KDA24_25135 [Deltaproteobacteria bacterium]|nr:hypothetical protein [Deltaproteobacteria bacterium]
MNRFLTLVTCLLVSLPAAALAGSFDGKDLAGCSLPVLSGAKVSDEVSNTPESGNIFYLSGGKQQWVFWLTGASAELSPESLKVYADALGNSGAWLGAEEATWSDVGTTKTATLPFKLSKDQPVAGQMLAWAHVPSGRVFWIGITPPWNSKGVSSVSAESLQALLAEAAPMIDCSGAGAVDRGLALFDPPPAGYGVDTSSPPTIRYNKPGHALVLWRAKKGAGEGKVSCESPANALFQSWGEALSLTWSEDATLVVDDIGGTGEGARCDVTRPVKGFTKEESGDMARYVMADCPNGEGAIAALEFHNDGIASSRADIFTAVCASELPEPPPEEPATPEQERKQWVPGQ